MRIRSVTAARAAIAALVFGALLAGCADDAGDTGPTPSPSTPATPSPSLPPPVLPTLPSVTPTLPPTSPPSTSREVTLTGELVEGVEAGCVLLQTTSGDYLLFGEPVEDMRTGTTVTVRGTVHHDMASTCQQGTPFEVAEVLR